MVDVVVGGEGRTNWVKVWYEWEEEKRKMFSTKRSQTVFGRKRFSPLNNKYFSKPPLKKKYFKTFKHSFLNNMQCTRYIFSDQMVKDLIISNYVFKTLNGR